MSAQPSADQADSTACPIPSSTSRASASSRPASGRRVRAPSVCTSSGSSIFAVSISEIGDALSYIALMWFALDSAGGALGVVAVRLADSVPGLVFGLHGGIAADRWSRRKLMVGADLVRGATPACPLRALGLFGVAAALGGSSSPRSCSRCATSYLAPAYGAAGARPRRPGERPAGERARPGDGAGALDRRLGARRACCSRSSRSARSSRWMRRRSSSPRR